MIKEILDRGNRWEKFCSIQYFFILFFCWPASLLFLSGKLLEYENDLFMVINIFFSCLSVNSLIFNFTQKQILLQIRLLNLFCSLFWISRFPFERDYRNYLLLPEWSLWLLIMLTIFRLYTICDKRQVGIEKLYKFSSNFHFLLILINLFFSLCVCRYRLLPN